MSGMKQSISERYWKAWMIPVIPPQQAFEMLDPEQLKVGDTFTVEEELHFKINHRDLEIKEERAFFCSFLKIVAFLTVYRSLLPLPLFFPHEKRMTVTDHPLN